MQSRYIELLISEKRTLTLMLQAASLLHT